MYQSIHAAYRCFWFSGIFNRSLLNSIFFSQKNMNSKWLVGEPTNFIYQLTIKWNGLDSLNQQTWMLPNVDTLWPVDPGVNIQKIRCCGACTSGALNVRSRERWSIESRYIHKFWQVLSWGQWWHASGNFDLMYSCDVAVASMMIYVKHAFRYIPLYSDIAVTHELVCDMPHFPMVQLFSGGEIMYGIIHTDKYMSFWVS